MRVLKIAEMALVAGGSAPALSCSEPLVSHASSGNVDVTVSTQVCQTSSGLTQTNRTEITVTHADGSVSGMVKRLFTGEADVDHVETKTETTTCTSKGVCKTESSTKHADEADGSDAQNLAFDQLGEDLGNSEGIDSFAGDGFSGDFGGGGTGDDLEIDAVLEHTA